MMTHTLVAAGCTLIVLAGAWKVFEKMGEKGWKALIPFYNVYILFKHLWNKKAFWIFLAATVLAGATFTATNVEITPAIQAAQAAVSVCQFAGSTTAFVMTVMLLHKLSKSFHHGVGYTLGEMLLPEIFVPVLGFGNAEYAGN